MKLSNRLEHTIEYHGKKYHLSLAYNRVLASIEIMRDKELLEYDKVRASIGLLVSGIVRLSLNERSELLDEIFDQFILPKNKGSGGTQVYDFNQDAEYIYASFMTDYGIDLYAEYDKMDWRKFIALFSGLSDKTKMREVIKIRTCEIPKPTQYNAKERAELIKAKQFYALKDTNNYQNGLLHLFDVLKSMAKG